MHTTVRGSGNVQTESRPVSNVTSVELDTSGDLAISQGESESLTIEAEDNLLPILTSDVHSGRLILGAQPNTNFSTTKRIRYTLVVKNLASMELNGSGNITATDLNTRDQFTAESNGSGDISLAALTADAANVDISGSGSLIIDHLNSPKVSVSIDGSGDVKIVGSTTNQVISLNGSGDFKGEQFTSKTAIVHANGSGKVTIGVSDTLDASLSGSGDVVYIGNPAVTKRTNGSGRIKQKA